MAARAHLVLCEEDSRPGWEQGKAMPNKPEEQRTNGGGTQQADWETVLDDVYEAILGHLQPQDVAALRCVCSGLRAKTDYLLHTLAVRQPRIPEVAARFQGLTHLHLKLVPNTAEISAEVLHPLRCLRRLQVLVVENRSLAQPTLYGLKILGAELHMLRSLHIMGCVVGPASGLAACTSLRSLRLSNCILMLGVEEGFPGMITGLSRLDTLACEGCSGLSSHPFAGLECLSSLKTCSLSRSLRVEDDTCRSLSLMPQVHALGLACSALSGCLAHPGISDAGVSALCALRHLTSLDLAGHTAITDAGVAAIGACLGALEHLDLRRPGPLIDGTSFPGDVRALTDAGICALASLRCLRSLRMSEAQVQQEGCAALASLAGSLRLLELSHCRGLSDTAACALGALGGLTELCLAGCCAVTDIAITALVRAMPDLARLDLGGCHLRVGSISLFAIATLQRLQALRLSSCEQVADAGIHALCAGPAARALLELDLRDCDRLTDAAAAGIGASLNRLRALNLEHCHRVSPRGVAALAQLPNLQELRLAGTGAGGIVTGGSFSNERVLLDAAPKQRIWWMLDA